MESTGSVLHVCLKQQFYNKLNVFTHVQRQGVVA
jgi:hypothetical protein